MTKYVIIILILTCYIFLSSAYFTHFNIVEKFTKFHKNVFCHCLLNSLKNSSIHLLLHCPIGRGQ
jgi:hypothetical protein